MSLLNNARDSIIMGLEDYSSGKKDSKRLISCARNLFAGILLLFKHKLAELSPPDSNEILIRPKIKAKKNEHGEIYWIGDGKNTVNVHEIKERFNSLGISVNWDRVDKVNKLRNDVEHYYSDQPKELIRNLLASSFIVIKSFIELHLEKDLESFLGKKSSDAFKIIAHAYNEEKERCIKTLNQVDWKSDSLLSAIVEYDCPICKSGLLTVQKVESDLSDIKFICQSCDYSSEFNEFIEEAISDYFGYQNYLAYTDGDEVGTISCPNCTKDTYIIHEHYCPLCGASVEHKCRLCGIDIPASEINGSGYCSWCDNLLSKDN
ncbi:MAG: hypothetical protein GC179_30760 [Anaerolineaceae bacterium]|nr:hypothetical protein [Anaerolineaceae bacterium]